MPGPVGTWMCDSLWAGKPSRYVTATEVDSASMEWQNEYQLSS